MLVVFKNFYKDYLRTIFDLENKIYTQRYNKKYDLSANNGFKIYLRYFYFSDKNKLRGLYSSSELYGLSDRRFSTKSVPTFCGWRVSRGQRNGSPRPLISVF
jgi:hypothetical protein